MKIEIDPNSGFCFGVVTAINKAEKELESGTSLYCLGDIVHNNVELERLSEKGLITINHEHLKELKNVTVLIRAHGEPPETYEIAKKNNIKLIDATCPVVLRLQKQIKKGYEDCHNKGGQIVIFGKEGHAEVNGLVGQTKNNAIVINSTEDIEKIDFTKPVLIYAQTTQDMQAYYNIIEDIKTRMHSSDLLNENITICRQVANRSKELKTFAKKHDVIVFVSGKKSSNGKVLYNVCKGQNNNTYFVSVPNELQKDWFINISSVGICGATSTPRRIMEEIADIISKY